MRAFLVAIKPSLAIAILVAFNLGSLPALAADSNAAGRKHAAKANQLAAKNKCKSAVVEFTKAYQLLKDPTILFNRAECQRKLSNNTDALMDYELFLAEMPSAPNRAGVEARIAALREVVNAESAAAAPGVPATPSGPVAPVVPAVPAAPVAPAAAKSGQQSPEGTRKVDKAPETPAHHAEKWAD